MSVAGAEQIRTPWRQRMAETRFFRWYNSTAFARWLRESAVARFVRRYIWVYIAYRILKWPVIFGLAYLLGAKAPWLQAMIDGKDKRPAALNAGVAGGDNKMDQHSQAASFIKVGDSMPDFTLPLYESGKDVRDFTLSEARGRTVVLYFYPMDDTPGCTKQACGLRDASADYAKFNALILGVSRDDADSHNAFAEKYHLPFGLLIDAEGKLRSSLGNPDGIEELISRITYIIDAEGVVRHIVGAGASVDDHLAESHEWAEKLAGQN